MAVLLYQSLDNLGELREIPPGGGGGGGATTELELNDQKKYLQVAVAGEEHQLDFAVSLPHIK